MHPNFPIHEILLFPLHDNFLINTNCPRLKSAGKCPFFQFGCNKKAKHKSLNRSVFLSFSSISDLSFKFTIIAHLLHFRCREYRRHYKNLRWQLRFFVSLSLKHIIPNGKELLAGLIWWYLFCSWVKFIQWISTCLLSGRLLEKEV